MNIQHDLYIKDFKTILKVEKERIQKSIDALKSELNSIGNEDEINDAEDMAELQIDNANDQAILHTLEVQMVEINAALERIMQGKYGICEKTGKYIPLERLTANPSARTVVEA